MTIAEILTQVTNVKNHSNFKKSWTRTLIGNLFQDIVTFIQKTGVTKTSNYTVAASDQKVYIDSSGGAFTITLEENPATDKEIEIIDKVGSCGTYTVTIDGNGNNIVGSSTALMNADYISFNLVFNSNNWNLK